MIKEAIGTGSTVEEAQEAAKISLDAPEDIDIKFEVLDLPVKKTFGLFGGSPARVKAFYEIIEKKKAEKIEKTEKVESNVNPDAKLISLDDANEQIKKANKYLLNILKGMGINNAKIEISQSGNEYFFNILCEDDYSIVIGRRGETLDSIQYLVRLAANRGKPNDEYVHIALNIGNYREKRENTLKEIANKSAKRVLKYKRNVSLDPMNPFERRIIHTTIADISGVNSHSVGSNTNRRVIITPEGGSRPNNRGGYNKNHNGGYNKNYNGGSRGRYNNNRRDNKPKYESTTTPSRPPKSDAAGTSLYGKIEPKK